MIRILLLTVHVYSCNCCNIQGPAWKRHFWHRDCRIAKTVSRARVPSSGFSVGGGRRFLALARVVHSQTSDLTLLWKYEGKSYLWVEARNRKRHQEAGSPGDAVVPLWLEASFFYFRAWKIRQCSSYQQPFHLIGSPCVAALLFLGLGQFWFGLINL